MTVPSMLEERANFWGFQVHILGSGNVPLYELHFRNAPMYTGHYAETVAFLMGVEWAVMHPPPKLAAVADVKHNFKLKRTR